MATYYYDPVSGSDSLNPGNILSPWQTLTHAIANSSAGDTLLGLGGATASAAETWPISLTSGRTLDSYGTGRVTLLPTSGHLVALQTTNCGNVTLQNLILKGSTTTYSGTVSRIVEFNFRDGALYSNFLINNCQISDGLGGCAFLNYFGGNNVVGSNIAFTNNVCFNLAVREGFTVASTNLVNKWFWTNVTCTGNVIRDVTGISPVGNNQSTYGITFEGCNGGTISNNLIRDIGANWTTGGAGTGPFGVEILSCKSVTCSNNAIYNIFTTGTQGGGVGIELDNYSQSCTVSKNYIFNCYGPGIENWASTTSGGSNVIAYNVIVNCMTYASSIGKASIHVDDSGNGGDSSCSIYGNTVLNTGAFPSMYFGTGCTANKLFYNNCLIAPPGIASLVLPAAIATPFSCDGNYHQSGSQSFYATLGSSNYTTLATWRAATSREASSVAAGNVQLSNPQPPPVPTSPPTGTAIPTASAFAPIASFPLVGGGISLSGQGIAPGADILGNAWSQNCIGAIYATAPPANSYEAAVSALNPIIRLRLAEASGSFAVCGVPGIQALAWTSITPGGPVLCPVDGGASYGFDGVASVARSPTLPTPYVLASAFSLEAWIEPTSVANATAVVANFRNGSSNDTCNLLLNNNILRFLVRDSINICQARPTSYLVAANVAIHVVGVWSGSNTLAIYVNGVSQALTYDNTATPVNPTFSVLNLGDQAALTRYFQGNLAPVNAYASALTAGQVANLYAQGIGGVIGGGGFDDGFGYSFGGGF
jgi:Concanavalin A-like lectin/glucanases superfamily/Right handed beta helix region